MCATNEDEQAILQEYYNCQGVCGNDDEGDGICDELEEGCTDESADNYNPQAQIQVIVHIQVVPIIKVIIILMLI